jgi:hypothetical protein
MVRNCMKLAPESQPRQLDVKLELPVQLIACRIYPYFTCTIMYENNVIFNELDIIMHIRCC